MARNVKRTIESADSQPLFFGFSFSVLVFLALSNNCSILISGLF